MPQVSEELKFFGTPVILQAYKTQKLVLNTQHMPARSSKILPPYFTPAQLPFGAPPGRYATIHVPRNGKAARFVKIEVSDALKKMRFFQEGSAIPMRQARTRGLNPRITQVVLNFGADVHLSHAYLNLDSSFLFVTGRLASPLVLRDDILLPQEATLTTYFSTPRGKKILHECYLTSEHPPTDIGWVLTRFDEYYAVDTNTVEITGIGKLSVTAVLRGRSTRIENGFSCAEFEFVFYDSAVEVVGNPELRAIFNLVSNLKAALPEDSRKLIGLITDTEQSLIREINARRQPLFLDYYLPQNFELLYATADSGATEFIPNKMMRECDKAATLALSHAIKKHPNSIAVSG